MRRMIAFAAALAAGLALPAAAMARPGYVTTDLHLRGGPSTSFGVKDTIPGGSRVNIRGCLDTLDWCKVRWSGETGWASSHYIEAIRHGRRIYVRHAPSIVPQITFSFGTGGHAHHANRHHHHAHHASHHSNQRHHAHAHHANNRHVHHLRHRLQHARHHRNSIRQKLRHARHHMNNHANRHHARHHVHHLQHKLHHAQNRVKHLRHKVHHAANH